MKKDKKSWGGNWTNQKLTVFEKYVRAYLTILNRYRDNCHWELIYFDGFAGSGSRKTEEEIAQIRDMFDGLEIDECDLTYRGAAERVLSMNIRNFDFLYFIEKSQDSCDSLKQKLTPLKKDYQTLEFRSENANDQLRRFADGMRKNPNKYKTLMLLDPFGMQIEWKVLELLKDLKGVDLWILVPTGVIVNRLLERNGALTHIDKLKSFFGIDEEQLKEFFYTPHTELTLFGEAENVLIKKTQPIERIAKLYIQCLKTLFKHVTNEPLVLKNNNGLPIFHFVFASNNQSAMRIAQEIVYTKR